MRDLLIKLSAVCFAAADELDRVPAVILPEAIVEQVRQELASKTASAPVPFSKFASSFRDATGEELPAELATKIATDADLADALSKFAASKTPRRALGGASDEDADTASVPRTKEGRVQQAYSAFEDMVLGRNS